MEGDRVRQWEAQCIEEQPPACSAACPVHVDVRKMAQSIGKGEFSPALKIFQHVIPLPRIIAHACDRPCERACRRSEAGDALNLGALELAVIHHAGSVAQPRKFGTRTQKIIIAGGGMRGVTAAIDLAVKGYQVSLYEAAPELLPHIRQFPPSQLPTEAIQQDLAALETLGVEVYCAAYIGREELCSLLEHCDALYVAFGDVDALAGYFEGSLTVDPQTCTTSVPKLFAGRTPRQPGQPYSPITSLHDGRSAALSIERSIQGAKLEVGREGQGPQTSRLYTDTSAFEPLPEVQPANPAAGYTREEAQQEAKRCFPCSCMECVKVCQYLKDYKSYPKRYVREIYNNLCIVMGTRNLNQMINSCTLCGLCETVCPEKMSMADVCLDARQTMVATRKMPVSAHDFALRDMAFSTSEAFAMAKHQPGHQKSKYLFFPGCQLAASSPEHVQSCYEFLCKQYKGGVGLLLNCCGAPALWAGRQDLFKQNQETLVRTWVEMDKPIIITACSSCFRTLKEQTPELAVESLWPHMNTEESQGRISTLAGREYAIHDPCSTRAYPEVEDAVRHLLQNMGIHATELNPRGETTCCGYGGLASFVNPELEAKSVQRRAAESDADYITYCAMCRDNFAKQGKRAVHVLDLLFDDEKGDAALRPDPGFSRRQDNRAHLKSQMLKLWGEDRPEAEQLPLTIGPEVRKLLETRMILEDDIRKTLEAAESGGHKFLMPNGHLLATHCPTCVTYWVEYTPAEPGYTIHNAYSHRMQVQ